MDLEKKSKVGFLAEDGESLSWVCVSKAKKNKVLLGTQRILDHFFDRAIEDFLIGGIRTENPIEIEEINIVLFLQIFGSVVLQALGLGVHFHNYLFLLIWEAILYSQKNPQQVLLVILLI